MQDLKHAVRAWLAHPGHLVIALVTLALGIGFSTATFSVINAVLLRPLPYEDPGRLVRLIERNMPRFPQFSVSPGHYFFWRDHATAFDGIGAWATQSVNLEARADDPARVRADRVTVNLFEVLGVPPIAGRRFEAADEQLDRANVALLSYGAWQRRFAGDPAVIGETIRLDRQPFTIVGVMPASLRLPSDDTELWVPFVPTDEARRTYGSHFMGAIARLRPGMTHEAAALDMQSVSRRLIEVNPGSEGWETLLFDLHDFTVDDVRQSLMVLLGAVALVLLMACANVANLLLARGAARQREVAIRSSIGATRGRLIRQLFVEQLALAAVSVVAGVLLAAWLLRVMLALMPGALPGYADVTLDRQVMGFALLLAVITPLLFGLLPALHASRPDLRSLLTAGGRQGAPTLGRHTRTVLVVAEIALAMTLLVGAGLLLRSFAKLNDQSPGFDPAGAVLAGVSLPGDKYPEGDARDRFFDEFLARVQAVPGVSAAGLANPMPMVNDFNSGYEIEGEPIPAEGRPITLFYAVGGQYFDAMRIPLRRGRYITDADRRGGHRVIVINEALASLHFGGTDPIGRRMRVGQGNNDWREIVGVVGNVKQFGLDDQPRAQVYEAGRQHPYFSAYSIVVRSTREDATAVVPELRTILRDMDRELPLARVRTLEDLVSVTIRPQRFSTTLIGVFGAAALALAAIGIYGVMAYTVGLRRQEFAVRIAHGAGPSDILRLVLRGAAAMSAAGIAIGVAAAWVMRGALQSLLFDVTTADVPTYLFVAAILAGTAFAASAIPARRAIRVDPIQALRGE